MARHNRQRAWTRGRRAETFAAWWLRLKGYRVLARNFRVAPGEIDLIARRQNSPCSFSELDQSFPVYRESFPVFVRSAFLSSRRMAAPASRF
jgi:hypothetical protein